MANVMYHHHNIPQLYQNPSYVYARKRSDVCMHAFSKVSLYSRLICIISHNTKAK